MAETRTKKVLIVEPSLDSKLNKQTSSLSLESRHSIQSSFDSSRTYQRRVSFDNVTNISPAFHSFTLKQCSKGFERSRRTRTFIVAIDLDSNKIEPLVFALTNLVDEGDEIVVVGVYSQGHLIDEEDLQPKDKAQEIMNWIVESHQGDNISMVVELTFGRPELALEEMLRMYQPSVVVVGSRNKAKYKHAYSGAGIFKYRLKHSSIPVVIVRDKLQPRPQLHKDSHKEPSYFSSTIAATQGDQHQQHMKLEQQNHQGLSRRVKKTQSQPRFATIQKHTNTSTPSTENAIFEEYHASKLITIIGIKSVQQNQASSKALDIWATPANVVFTNPKSLAIKQRDAMCDIVASTNAGNRYSNANCTTLDEDILGFSWYFDRRNHFKTVHLGLTYAMAHLILK
ncbi:hypothetical protein [Parasitella parasitica]|uniref:Uncharacterized protein n=1 Tax=Parasitella parasitica TaxID=35722 RepID=A0A0B7NN75_9FUNG|nr:hypothetical protein [Parasitella parasitica]